MKKALKETAAVLSELSRALSDKDFTAKLFSQGGTQAIVKSEASQFGGVQFSLETDAENSCFAIPKAFAAIEDHVTGIEVLPPSGFLM